MGQRRTVQEKARPKPRARHVWLYPTPGAVSQVQGFVVEFGVRRDATEWWRVVYVSPENPPTLVDTYVPARVCVPVQSQPSEPNY